MVRLPHGNSSQREESLEAVMAFGKLMEAEYTQFQAIGRPVRGSGITAFVRRLSSMTSLRSCSAFLGWV
jgi:hypothetical protein